MSLGVILSPYGDPSELDERAEERIHKQIEEQLSSYPHGKIDFELKQTDHGVGADWATVYLIIRTVGDAVVLIPKVRKRIGDTIAGWRNIKKDLDRLLAWLGKDTPIVSYSKEIAFYTVLGHLDEHTNALNAELILAQEIPGKSGASDGGFDSSPIMCYVFVFEVNYEVFTYAIDSRLKLVAAGPVDLDPFRRHAKESET